jgi:hypothetical protein
VGISNALAISALSVEDGMAGKAVSKHRASTETHAVCANDAMRIMLIGRGYLPNREDYPREALAAALPVLYREQTGHPRKERRLNLLLRLRHGPPPCKPDDASQAVLDLATRDWWYYAPDESFKHPRRHQPLRGEAIKDERRCCSGRCHRSVSIKNCSNSGRESSFGDLEPSDMTSFLVFHALS